MNSDEFKMLLAPYLAPDHASTDAESNRQGTRFHGPFDDFFGDAFLLLIYHCTDTLPRNLAELRDLLVRVSDESRSVFDRSVVAIEIAQFLIDSRRSENIKTKDTAADWLKLAARWENVVAHVELATLRLAESGLEIDGVLKPTPFPTTTPIDSRKPPQRQEPSHDVVGIWERGAHLALLASTSNFKKWNSEFLFAGFTCVTHYVAFLPQRFDSEHQRQFHARQLAKWALPLLAMITRKIRKVHPSGDALSPLLERRQQAIRLMLESAARDKESEVASFVAAPSESTTEYVIVIKGEIPKASDRSDNDLLTQYEVLRKPTALAAMPSLDRIEAIQEAMKREFPWAQAALETIMSEIRARKRFGSKVLGMQPVLLCGPPGSGKSRLSQRLSELLEIPSTVINMAGMTDTKTLKGVTRGWSSNRPSRIVESVLRTGPSHLFLLDEVDKAHGYNGGNGGDPQEALLDLLEPLNARRYGDVFLQTECDVSHCLYILTANSLSRISEPLLSRLSLAYVPAPGPEYSLTIAHGILRDLEKTWRIPEGALQLDPPEMRKLTGLSPREMRRAVLAIVGDSADLKRFTLH